MKPEAIRLRCLEAACEFAVSSIEAVAIADMFANYVAGNLTIEDIDPDDEDALDECEEGQFNEH